MLLSREVDSELENRANIIYKNGALNQYCTEEQKAIILQNLSCRTYHKGEVVFYEGQPSFLIYFVSTGLIKLWKEGFHKVEQVIRFSKAGDMLGFWGSLENKNYSLSASAITDSKVYFIKKDVFLPIVQANLSLTSILHDYIMELKKTEVDLRNMAEMNVREKVAHSVLELMGLFRNKIDEEAYRIVLSRKEISSLSSISEDRVSKQLSDFKKEKIISVVGDRTVIDENALQEIIRPYLVMTSALMPFFSF